MKGTAEWWDEFRAVNHDLDLPPYDQVIQTVATQNPTETVIRVESVNRGQWPARVSTCTVEYTLTGPPPPSPLKEEPVEKTPIKDTLPLRSKYPYPLHSAIRVLAWAMQDEANGWHDQASAEVREALALVRYHRKGLPDQGRRQDDYPDRYGDMLLLYIAINALTVVICNEQLVDEPFQVRKAEAALRTWLKRRLAEKEEQR